MKMNTGIQAAGMDRRIQTASPYKPGLLVSKAKGDYDTVTIHGPRCGKEEGDFARILAWQTAAQLSPAPGPKRIEQLQEMVASGTYQPDADIIARRLLGLY